jgi:hypothetical protein
MLHLMCCYNVEIRVSIILRHLIKHQETFFMRSVKGAKGAHSVVDDT